MTMLKTIQHKIRTEIEHDQNKNNEKNILQQLLPTIYVEIIEVVEQGVIQ